MRLIVAFCFFVALGGALPVRADTAEQAACTAPADLTTPSAPLSAVASALAAHRPVEILALGSGSTVGDTGGNSGPAFAAIKTPAASFPYRMVDALHAMRKGDQFQLTVAGGRNVTAASMLAILHDQLATHHFDLVLWQTGTVEAVRGLRPDTLSQVLQEGVGLANGAHADVVLIDPQFSRFLRANTDLGPYEAVLEQVAGLQDVTLFRRFDLTQDWVNSGAIDLERVGREQRDKTIALLNTCLGQALAKYVLTGAGEH